MQMGRRTLICDYFHPSELPIGIGHFDIIGNLVRTVIRIGRGEQTSMEVCWRGSRLLA